MTEEIKSIHLVILGALPDARAYFERPDELGGCALHVSRIETLEAFEAFEPGENDVYLIDTDADVLGMGVLHVVNAVKQRNPFQPVVMIVRAEDAGLIVLAQHAGLDEYVIRDGEPGFHELLSEALMRARRRSRRDLPALLAVEMSRLQFWAFFDSVPVPMKVLDADGRLLQVNEAATRFFGFDENEMVGQLIYKFMHPDEVEHAEEMYGALLASGGRRATHEAEYEHHIGNDRRYISKTGEFVWGDLFLLALWNADGSFRHVIGIIVDITQRKRAMHDLQAREAKERAILDTTVDGIVTLDADGTIESANRACERMFGYAQGEVIGQNIAQLIPSFTRAVLEPVFEQAGQDIERHEIQGRRKGEASFPLEFGIARMEIDGEHKFTAALRDISERKIFIERLRRSERMEAVGQLAGGLAHDFNNVLTIITTFAYLLESQGGLDREADLQLQKILAATERGARLTDQLLALSPNPVTEFGPLSLNDVVKDVERLLHSVLEEDIAFGTELDPELHVVDADLGNIEQILFNLIINARDAMPGGGELTIRTCNVTIGAEHGCGEHPSELAPGDYALLQVEDSGRGMAAEIRERIFDPFFTTKEHGTGLGLATVANIVEHHGGLIEVRSAEGQGSSFNVYLPAAEGDVSKGQEPVRSPELPSRAGSYTILLVEDEDDIRLSLTGVFKNEGYTVLSAANAEEALELAERHDGPIDLILTDIVMPGMNGVELAERLHELYPEMRAVFVSGYAGEALRRKRISPNQVHIAKPYDVRALKEAVRQMLSR
ncbi:MAG: PAS domain S-box protein [Bradymonadaceae bacterium]|nr:PAS domain S-box protein [Lujinxingiaceae bacterium]